MKTTLLLILSSCMLLAAAAQAQSGDAAAIYHDFCSVCHGDRGDGNSHAQQGLVPPPRDFTSPQSAVELSRERMIAAITHGVPGTAMTGWKTHLSESQIASLADLIQTRFMMSAALDISSPGSRIYADNCSVCHGESGQGAIWATEGLSPPPINFTDPAIQASLARDHMIDAVTNGRAETAMAGWKGRLSEQEIGTVVDYVIEAFMPASDMAKALTDPTHTAAADAHAHHNHTHFNIDRPFTNKLTGDLESGETLYRSNCATCHGDEGDGRGPRAYFINPKPRNFLHTNSRASLNRPALFEAVSKGRLRTEMPAWEKVLTRQQIADVSEYVFNTFIKP